MCKRLSAALALVLPCLPTAAAVGAAPLSGAAQTAEIRLAALEPASRPMRGRYRYLADSARFTDCASGRSYPVARGGESPALERAYLKHRGEPGAWLTVDVAGHLEQPPQTYAKGTEETIVVDRFDSVWPGEGCGKRIATPPLEGPEWRLVEIEGRPLSPAERARNPRLRLEPDRLQVLGDAGCNRFFGGYRRNGETGLRFEQIASTRRYCMEAMDLEGAVLEVLAKSAEFRISEGRLVLLSGSGEPLAAFEASQAEAAEPE
jgi:heat shock protein HslJ